MVDNKKIESDIKEKLVAINRITVVKVVAIRFRSISCCRQSERIYWNRSVNSSWCYKKSYWSCKNSIKIPLKDGRTLHHDVKGKNGSGKVFLRAAPAGTGIIAGGAIRSVCEVLGIQDVVAKSLGSANPHNVLKACVNGLKSQNSPKILSVIRGKKISEIVSKREAK